LAAISPASTLAASWSMFRVRKKKASVRSADTVGRIPSSSASSRRASAAWPRALNARPRA
jgi:hypothetical protein